MTLVGEGARRVIKRPTTRIDEVKFAGTRLGFREALTGGYSKNKRWGSLRTPGRNCGLSTIDRESCRGYPFRR